MDRADAETDGAVRVLHRGRDIHVKLTITVDLPAMTEFLGSGKFYAPSSKVCACALCGASAEELHQFDRDFPLRKWSQVVALGEQAQAKGDSVGGMKVCVSASRGNLRTDFLARRLRSFAASASSGCHLVLCTC